MGPLVIFGLGRSDSAPSSWDTIGVGELEFPIHIGGSNFSGRKFNALMMAKLLKFLK